MRNGVLRALAVAALLVPTAGCQRLNYTKKFTLGPMAVQKVDFSAPAYEQKLKVTVTPTGGPVSAYLTKADDAQAVERFLDGGKEPPASLLLGSRVSQGSAETYSFDATVPAKVEYTLLLRAQAKGTDVSIAVVGR
jgi:hypothetical protein